jgi:8-oxo-dGTP pyrophosphatase MutT (NUDIX family)
LTAFVEEGIFFMATDSTKKSSLPRVAEQAGAVLCREALGEIQVLTVRSKASPKQRIFPKGHIENGENAEETAVRELLEEGGMVGEIIGYAGLREFTHKNKLYRVKYYAAKYISNDNEGEPGREPQWASAAETRAILPFEDLKDVLDRSVELFSKINPNFPH